MRAKVVKSVIPSLRLLLVSLVAIILLTGAGLSMAADEDKVPTHPRPGWGGRIFLLTFLARGLSERLNGKEAGKRSRRLGQSIDSSPPATLTTRGGRPFALVSLQWT